MQVISTKSIHFPKFNWGINAGEVATLPEGKDAQDAILAHPCIAKKAPVEKSKTKKADINSNKSSK